MDDLASQTGRMTKWQRIAFGIKVAAGTLMLLPIILSICAWPLSYFPHFANSLNKPPHISFLRDQYDFLLTSGIDPISAAPSLWLFQFLIVILIPIVLLRLVSSPLLFGLINWRKKIQDAGGSIIKFVIAWLLMPGAVWLSTDIRVSSSVEPFGSLLKLSPQMYIGFEAFLFIGCSILFVEESIALVDMSLTWIRERRSSQPSEDSEA